MVSWRHSESLVHFPDELALVWQEDYRELLIRGARRVWRWHRALVHGRTHVVVKNSQANESSSSSWWFPWKSGSTSEGMETSFGRKIWGPILRIFFNFTSFFFQINCLRYDHGACHYLLRRQNSEVYSEDHYLTKPQNNQQVVLMHLCA
jgi:hypothetical protein